MPDFQMPKVNEHHQRLHKLSGAWVGEEQMMPSPWSPGGARVGRSDIRVACDGFCLVQSYEQHESGKRTFEGHGIFAIDPATQEVTWYWIDSMGMPGLARGKWTNESTLVLEGRTDQGVPRGRFTYVFEGDQRHRFKLESSQDGGKSWQTFMEASYRRA